MHSQYFSHVEIKTATPVNTLRCRSSGLSPTPNPDPIYELRHRSHRWTLPHETALCVLERYYVTRWPEKRKIFNAHFAAELPSGAIHQGVTLSAICNRIQTMMRDEDSRAWNKVFIDETFYSTRWVALRTDLERTASEIGVTLVAKEFEHKLEVLRRLDPYQIPKRKRCTSPTSHGVLGSGALPRSRETDEDERLRTPKKSTNNRIPKTPTLKAKRLGQSGLMTPPSSSASQQGSRFLNNPSPPRLGFRFFCNRSFGRLFIT